MEQVLHLHNDVEEVPLLGEWTEQLAAETNMPPDDAFQLNMVLEEAVVNVMEYAYPGQTGMPVTLEVSVHDDVYRFVLTDEGVAFDPTADSIEPDVTQGAEERPIGGLGIFLVKQYMQHVSYRREDGRNILTMEYKLGTMANLAVDML